MGDLLTAVPALRALARAFPSHRRILAAPVGLAELALHIGAIDEVVDTPHLEQLDPRLRGADVAVNLHGRGPESTALLAASAPHRLIAFDHGAGAPAWRPDEHEVTRWCRLLQQSGIAADPDDLHVAVPDRRAPPEAIGATIVHPGAADGARRWPADRWAAVVRSELRSGRRVVVTGGPDERRLASQVASRAGLDQRYVLAGRTDLLDLLVVVAAGRRVVCGDTGVAHVASAVRTPSVVLFGPVPPSAWGPPHRDRHIALWAGMPGDPHATRVDRGLLHISVADVVAALDRLPPACPVPSGP